MSIKAFIFDFNILMENKNYISVLINEANLSNNFYNYTDIQPCVMIWKQLVKGNQTPAILVPDTLILNDKQNALIWIYTNKKGKLQKNVDINLKDFVNKVTNYCSPNQLAVTLKKVTYNQHFINGNDVKLLNARYLQNCSLQQLGGQKQTIICVQKYVKSNGKNAYICRSIWKKNCNSTCYIITNKKSFYDQEQIQSKKFLVKASFSTCSIVKSVQGTHLKQTTKYLNQIVNFFKINRGTILSQIVGDFIKDETGNWWLINIKAFNIQSKLNKHIQLRNKKYQNEENQTYQKQKYQKTKICRYCQKTYLQSEVNHNITIKMLIQTDRYLLHLGKDYKWLRRSDIQNVDSHCLYQEHKICERCYCLYTEIQALMEIEGNYLRQLGFQLQKKPKQLLMSLTNEEQLKNQSKNKQINSLALQIPSSIQLGPNSKIIFNENCPLKNDQMINKMIRYRVIVYFKELDLIKNIKKDHNYYLQYTLFGVKTKFKIDIFNQKQTQASIKKIRINYFFAHSHEDVSAYINKADDFLINIIAQNKNEGQKKIIGNLKLPMKDFISVKINKKDFYKLCSVDNVSYGWGLEGSIGIIPSQTYVNTSRMIFFTNDHLIFLPNQNYYYCQQLPEEWIDLLKKEGQKQKNSLKIKNQKQEKESQSQNIQIGQKEQNETHDSQTWKSLLNKQIKKYQKTSVCYKMEKTKRQHLQMIVN